MSTIEVFSDFLCPFCYIAEASTLSCLQSRYPTLEVVWKGFELHPEIPRGGVRLEDFFPESGVLAFKARLTAMTQEFGVEEFELPQRLPNTMRAHALTEYAHGRGMQRPVRESLMEAYWRHGRDLEDPDVLAQIASENGLCPDKALLASASPYYEMKVIQNRATGYERGVSGVPTFFVDGKAVVGCQAVCAIEEAMTA